MARTLKMSERAIEKRLREVILISNEQPLIMMG